MRLSKNMATTSVVLFLWFGRTVALEKDAFYLQAQVGLFRPQSPKHITSYWSSSVDFSGGFGVILEKNALLFTYTNQVFNSKSGIVADGLNAYGHNILMNFKYFCGAAKVAPFWLISGGYSFLSTPSLYKESELITGMIDENKLLEQAHDSDGLTLGVGAGFNYQLSSSSLIFLELYGSTWLKSNAFTHLGVRSGVLFQIGN